jgi:tetratricopeptide (TPR) repeat protein
MLDTALYSFTPRPPHLRKEIVEAQSSSPAILDPLPLAGAVARRIWEASMSVPRLDRSDLWIAFASFVALFAIYAAGACRTIYVGDSGELVTAVYVLGIPHPTGYPLYVLLGKLWTVLVPVGSIALRMSLFSAACAATACALLFVAARRCGGDRLAALAAALSLAFSPSFWGEANIQRVYALNAAFLAAALLVAGVWVRRRDRWSFAVTMFVAALGAANHTYMAIFAIAFALFVLRTRPRFAFAPRTIAVGAAAVMLGLLPYLYLPLASRADPPLDWGDPETLERFLDVVLRRGFWERAWVESPADFLRAAADYALGLARELTWAGLPLAVLGLLVADRRRVPILLLVVAAGANLAVMAMHGSRSDLFIWHRYYIPSYLIAALLLALGTTAVLARLPRRARPLVFVLPLSLLVAGWRQFDRSDYRIAEDFSATLLAGIPPGASLAATDDNILFVLLYLTMVEGRRPDVNLILQGVGGASLPPLRFDPRREPLFFTHHPNWDSPDLQIVPAGLAFRVWPRDAEAPQVVLPPDALPGADDPQIPKDYLTRNLIGQYYFMLAFDNERRDWARAAYNLERAMRAAPDNDVLFYNAGLLYERNGHLTEALRAFERSAAINPRHIPGSRNALASAMVARLRATIASQVSDPKSQDGAP